MGENLKFKFSKIQKIPLPPNPIFDLGEGREGGHENASANMDSNNPLTRLSPDGDMSLSAGRDRIDSTLPAVATKPVGLDGFINSSKENLLL